MLGGSALRLGVSSLVCTKRGVAVAYARKRGRWELGTCGGGYVWGGGSSIGGPEEAGGIQSLEGVHPNLAGIGLPGLGVGRPRLTR